MASTLTELIYHVFFSTKDRKPMIRPNMRDELYYIGDIIIKQDAVLLQIGGIEDHLHIVIKVKPTHKLSELMQKIKRSASKWIKNKFESATKFGCRTIQSSGATLLLCHLQLSYKSLAIH